MTGCKFNSSNYLSENAPIAVQNEVIKTSELPRSTNVNQANHLYKKLVEQYGEDYKSCGLSIKVKAKACDAEGITGKTEAENLNVELILDSSGSMAGLVGGEEKLTIAKDVLTDFVTKLPSQANVALRVYGHIGSNQEQDQAKSCAGTEMLYDFQPLNKDKFTTVIKSFSPTGWTPIADSLKQAGNDFSVYNAETNNNVVYLVSDGIETCNGDPIAAAKALNQSKIKAIVNIIGFDVDAEATKQLQAIAKAGGGEYIEADTRNDLYRIFNEKISSAYKQYNCINSAQYDAHNQTSSAQYKRSNCISRKAYKEYNAISSEAYEQYNADKIDAETRSVILDIAREKRNRLVKAVREERNSIVKKSREERNRIVDEAREERNSIK
jgi:hypothetical protein